MKNSSNTVSNWWKNNMRTKRKLNRQRDRVIKVKKEKKESLRYGSIRINNRKSAAAWLWNCHWQQFGKHWLVWRTNLLSFFLSFSILLSFIFPLSSYITPPPSLPLSLSFSLPPSSWTGCTLSLSRIRCTFSQHISRRRCLRRRHHRRRRSRNGN